MIRRCIYIVLVLILYSGLALSQDYTGINTSRFFPLQNLANQPADLVRSDSKWHINVSSAQLALVDFSVFNQSDLLSSLTKGGATDLDFFLGSEKSLIFGRGRVMLPSVSYKINHKHAVAFSTNIRADGIYSSSNDEFLNIFRGIDNPELLDELANEYFKSVVNSWIEFNLTWSTILLETKNHLLTGGISLKFMSGGGSGYFDMDGIEVLYDDEKIEYFNADISYAVNSNLDKAITDGKIDLFGNVGIGMDLGFSYSYTPAYMTGQKEMPYKFKIGLLIGDIGRIKHTENIQAANLSVAMEDVPYSRFEGIGEIGALIDSLNASVNFGEVKQSSFKMNLPTSVSLSGDYCFNPNWYVAGNIGFQARPYAKTIDILNKNILRFNLTPRFENEKWGAYVPISYNNQFHWTSGLAMRWRYIFIGSSTVISNLINSENGHGEMYLGINIPLGKME